MATAKIHAGPRVCRPAGGGLRAGMVGGAAPPVHPGKAPAARTVGLPGDRATGAGPAAILSECGDEIGMHGQFLPLGASSASRAEILLSCIAGCSGVSGRGYYAAGPVLDVQDVPAEVKLSLSVLQV